MKLLAVVHFKLCCLQKKSFQKINKTNLFFIWNFFVFCSFSFLKYWKLNQYNSCRKDAVVFLTAPDSNKHFTTGLYKNTFIWIRCLQMGNRAEKELTGRKHQSRKRVCPKVLLFDRFTTLFILGEWLPTCIWKRPAAVQLFIVNKNPAVVITCKSTPWPILVEFSYWFLSKRPVELVSVCHYYS